MDNLYPGVFITYQMWNNLLTPSYSAIVYRSTPEYCGVFLDVYTPLILTCVGVTFFRNYFKTVWCMYEQEIILWITHRTPVSFAIGSLTCCFGSAILPKRSQTNGRMHAPMDIWSPTLSMHLARMASTYNIRWFSRSLSFVHMESDRFAFCVIRSLCERSSTGKEGW